MEYLINPAGSADHHANWIRTKVIGLQNISPTYRTEGLAIFDESGQKVKDISCYVKDIIQGQETKEYLEQKHGQTASIIENIEWEGLDVYLCKLPMHQKTNRLQLIHNWQNVGHQKRKFAKTKYHFKHKENLARVQLELIEEGIEQEAAYPFQCGEEEAHLHFMTCQANKIFSIH